MISSSSSKQNFSTFDLVHTPILVLKRDTIIFANIEAISLFHDFQNILNLFSNVPFIDKKIVHLNMPSGNNVSFKLELSNMSKSNVLVTLTVINDNPCLSRYKSEYLEISKLGKGAFGTVHKVKHLLDHQIYAVKRIKICSPIKNTNFSLNAVNNAEDHSILKEVVLFAKISHHPNVIRYYSAWLEPNLINNSHFLYIQMDYPGDTLRQWLDTRTVLCSDTCNSIFVSICAGLNHIHSFNIIHRDLTPNNIFIDANTNHIYIGDFGCSEQLLDLDKTHKKTPSNAIGTPTYSSPESNGKSKYSVGIHADCYSLGIILFELFNIFKTAMERAIAIGNVKKGEYETEFTSQFPFISRVVTQLLLLDPTQRCGVGDLLQMFQGRQNEESDVAHSWSGNAGECMLSSAITSPYTTASSPQSFKDQNNSQTQKSLEFKKYLSFVLNNSVGDRDSNSTTVEMVAAIAEEMFSGQDKMREDSLTPISDLNDDELIFELDKDLQN